MSSVSLTLRQTVATTVVSGGATYQVTNAVTTSTGIDPAVFVFKTDTQAFDHYATAPDMDALPDTWEAAVAAGLGFYRQSSVSRTWTTISAMNDDLSITKARLGALAREVSQLQGAIVSDQTVVISAG